MVRSIPAQLKTSCQNTDENLDDASINKMTTTKHEADLLSNSQSKKVQNLWLKSP